MIILCDIGGTHVRFALKRDGQPAEIEKYQVADYPSFDEALGAYCADKNISCSTIFMALAAHQGDDGIWRFVNRNNWEIDTQALAESGMPVEVLLNDFEAAVWGLIDLQPAAQDVFRSGRKEFTTAPRCLIGPGTGLGLGYLVPLSDSGDVYHVQPTLGGHMPAAALTEEQKFILSAVARVKDRGGWPVFEDVVSGPGLLNIYNAVCLMAGRRPELMHAQDLLECATHPDVELALRLFHEFFGLFAATVVVTGNAYGGLYLMGGMFDRLHAAGLFDLKKFEEFFIGDFVPSVHNALEATPLIRVEDPYLSLKGLIKAYG